MTLTILYACIRCRRIGLGVHYDLRTMWGMPMVCNACANEKPRR